MAAWGPLYGGRAAVMMGGRLPSPVVLPRPSSSPPLLVPRRALSLHKGRKRDQKSASGTVTSPPAAGAMAIPFLRPLRHPSRQGPRMRRPMPRLPRPAAVHLADPHQRLRCRGQRYDSIIHTHLYNVSVLPTATTTLAGAANVLVAAGLVCCGRVLGHGLVRPPRPPWTRRSPRPRAPSNDGDPPLPPPPAAAVAARTSDAAASAQAAAAGL